MGFIRTHEGENNYFLGNVGIRSIPSEALTVAGNIDVLSGGSISAESISAVNYFGTWEGNTLSGTQLRVEGTDIKSTSISGNQDFYLKASGDGTAIWDIIQNHEITFDSSTDIGGDLTVRGDIIEYAADGVIYSKTSVFSKSLTSGLNTLNTFEKTQFKTAKYVISLVAGTNRTACEILVAHNGTTAEGTTYGIVDCQATSLLTDVSVSVGSSNIDLLITVSSDCSATVNGVAHY
tara:strand:- start:1077 stop:1781 length:705 start_codon:yes stop_codon:yes gene_type:complete